MSTDESLLPAGIAFLQEALGCYASRKYPFAVLHAVTATELLLKERLRRIDPRLILLDPQATNNSLRTVGLATLPHRLRESGVVIDPTDESRIRDFARWRNEIVHHLASFDDRLAKARLPQLLDFIALFMRLELTTPLESVLDKPLFSVAHGLIADWERATTAASLEAAGAGAVLPDACPSCRASGVLGLAEDRSVFCHMCGSRLALLDHCAACGRRTVATLGWLGDDEYCDECLERAGDQYQQWRSDYERGK